MDRKWLWIAAWVATAGVAGLQRTEVLRLRGELAKEDAALAESNGRLEALSARLAAAERTQAATAAELARLEAVPTRAPAADVSLRDGERRLILNGYRDLIARMNLPPAATASLENLLVDRVETLVDAEDAAERQGIADGSAQMLQVEGQAIAGLDDAIAQLLGPAEGRLFAAAAPTVVQIVETVAPEEAYAAPEPIQADYTDQAYVPYPAYLVGGFVPGPRRRIPERPAPPPARPRYATAPGMVVQPSGISSVVRAGR